MLHNFINALYRFAGRTNYSVDEELRSSELLVELSDRLTSLVRGTLRGLFFESRSGLTFIDPAVKIRSGGRLKVGRSLVIERGAELNMKATNGVVFGDNVTVKRGTIIECGSVLRNLGDRLVVGNGVGFSPYCYISVRGPVTIGDSTIFGPAASLYSENHTFSDPDAPVVEQGQSRQGVNVGEGCWIGSHATILDGVTLGDGCVVAAGAVVTRSFPPGSVIAGVPASLIKSRA